MDSLGFIGAGNMARSLIGGLCARGFERSRIVVCDPVAAQLESVAGQFGVRTSPDNDVAALSDILVLAVKPQDLPAVAVSIASAVQRAAPLVVSVAAGIRIAALSRWLDHYQRIVRAMPNRPALLRAGVTGLFAGSAASMDDRRRSEELLQAVGTTVWVSQEEDLDAVTAISGSGPAYFFLFIEALESAARELGLPPEIASTLALETAYGAALMAREREFTPEELRTQVTSRGGTTAAALTVLEEADLRGIVRRAAAAACRRSAELAAGS